MPTFAFFQVSEVENKEGGIYQLYLAPVSWFDDISEPPTSGSAGATATVTTDHDFATGYGWLQFTLIANKEGNLKVEADGEYPNQKTKTSFDGQLMGLSAEQLEFMKQSKNTRFIGLIKDGNCGDHTVYQVGCECKPLFLKCSWSSEDNIFHITGEAMCDLAVYTGSIIIES